MLRYQGVHVSCIEPGPLDTPFFDTAAEAQRRDGYAGSTETHNIYAKAVESAAGALADSPDRPNPWHYSSSSLSTWG
jgi:short-subunit dehydrogenase